MVDDREVLFVRVTPEMKRWLENYATERGISVSAAVSVLLTEARRRDRGSK